MRNYYVYTLEDINGEIRYVGYTSRTPRERLKDHFRNVIEAEMGERKWNKRLSWLKSCKYRVIIKRLDESTDLDYIKELEIYWISQFKSWGFRLTNMTSGGDGGNTWGNLSEEDRKLASERLSKALKGKPKPEGFSKNLSESRKGIGNPMYGKIPWNKGKSFSNETRKKQSESAKNRSLYSEIQKCDDNGNILESFKSIKEVESKYPYKRSSIMQSVKKECRAYGYRWRAIKKV